MCPEDADGIANIVDPDQTACLRSRSTLFGQAVRTFRNVTVFHGDVAKVFHKCNKLAFGFSQSFGYFAYI